MVDRADIPRISALDAEKTTVRRALENLNSPEGHINGVMITGPTMPVTINTTGWEYPPQMVEVIKQNLIRRQEQIQKELSELGVTNLDEPDRR